MRQRAKKQKAGFLGEQRNKNVRYSEQRTDGKLVKIKKGIEQKGPEKESMLNISPTK